MIRKQLPKNKGELFMKILIVAAMLSTSVVTYADQMTRENGAPVGDNQNSQTAGEMGPTLLQDSHLIEKLARFDRERIPERVVHARGTGAYGEFVSSADISDLTRADVFKKGKKTKVFTRFSTVIHPKGSPETLRDPHGFATKFYTQEGNWDLVGNNLPIFFIRDAIKFPDMIHSLKPSPVTNVQDQNRVFDFFAYHPEAIQMFTQLYTNLGTPASYREMEGNGVHAFKLVNKKGEVTYAKFHWKSHQPGKGLNLKQASEMQGKDFNHLTNDLYSNINKKNFPKWDLMLQTLKPSELNSLDFNPLDATKEWIYNPGFKEVKIGTMTLNKVPDNFFENTEMSGFAPSNLVPGIEPSEDRMLQGRLFSYADTQRYRLGVNHLQIPVNRPVSDVRNYGQEGAGNQGNEKSDINYQPNTFNGKADRNNGVYSTDPQYKMSKSTINAQTQQEMIKKTLNFRQAGLFYRGLSQQDKNDLITNLTADLGQVKNVKVRNQFSGYAYAADEDYGTRLANAVKADLAEVKKIAKEVNDDPAKK